jgi:biopolymer transport protein ExbD
MKRRFASIRRERRPVTLNVIPLIDIVFFLLVFYVVNASFDREHSVRIVRPGSTAAAASERSFLAVAIAASGRAYVDDRAVDRVTLPVAVRAAIARGAPSRVIIQADRKVETGVLLTVMDGCRAGGATDVEVAAVRETPR